MGDVHEIITSWNLHPVEKQGPWISDVFENTGFRPSAFAKARA